MEDLHRAICMFYQLISRRTGRTASIGRGAGPKKSVEFPGYVRPALKHLANVPEVAQSAFSRAAVIETIVDRSQKSERTVRLQRRRLARKLYEKNNCHIILNWVRLHQLVTNLSLYED
ncbi:hypothetical protein NXS19_008378 [Fusarium pseudograminearum]|nr:hypothetical protein NXS19_008378 [Fusarium pseudograminearum]